MNIEIIDGVECTIVEKFDFKSTGIKSGIAKQDYPRDLFIQFGREGEETVTIFFGHEIGMAIMKAVMSALAERSIRFLEAIKWK